jgi:hypothetical protein
MKLIFEIMICIIIPCLLVFGVSAFMIAYYPKTAEPSQVLMSQAEVQELLNKLEPENPIEVDGVIGKTSREKWTRVYCNQCNEAYFPEED